MNAINNINTKILATILLTFFVLSCTNDVTNAPPVLEEDDIVIKSVNDLNLLMPELVNAIPADNFNKYNQGKTYSISSKKEEELKKILEPLTNAGSDFWDEMNIEDEELRDKFDNLKGNEVALLGLFSLIAKDANGDLKGKIISNSQVYECAKVALGIPAINEIASLKSLESAVKSGKVLKIIGKVGSRYLGYFGVAVATVSFVNCING